MTLGGDRGRALRNLGRAVEAIAAARAFTLDPAKAKHERLRIGTKARGTVVLQDALVRSLDRIRSDFFKAAFPVHNAESWPDIYDTLRWGQAMADLTSREADTWDEDAEQRALAAADAMSEGDLEAVLAEAVTLLYEQGVAHAKLEVGTSFSVDAARAKKAIDERALSMSKKVVDDEREALKQIIRDAFNGGSSIPEIKRQILDFFGEGVHTVTYGEGGPHERVVPIDTWANTLARTEVSMAQNAGIFDLYNDAGIDQIQWLTADDERVCPECAALDGEIVNLGDAFEGGVAQPPLHPNCRCTIIAVDNEAAA